MSIITENDTPTVAKKVPFYVNRNYAFLWGGQAISNLGDIVFDTTLTLWVATVVAKGQPWAPLATGGAVLSAALPTFIVGPLAGVFVDRWDKRRTMIWMDLIRALLIMLLLLMVIPLPFLQAGRLPAIGQLALIYFVLVLTTICSLFFNPARLTIIRDVVHESQLERTTGLAMLTQNILRIVGPFLAAPLLFVFGVQWALLINALSFLVSAYAVKWVQPSIHTRATSKLSRSGFWSEFNEGLLFLLKSRVLLVVLLALSFTIAGDAAEQTLGVFFMIENLHAPTALYGIVGMVGGTGGILGTLVATYVAERLGALRSFWLGITGFGMLIFLFSRLNAFTPALVLIFLVGFPSATVKVALNPLLLRSIPRKLLGRVIAAFSTFASAISLLSISLVSIVASLLQGFHASVWIFTFSDYDTIFAVCGLFTAFIGLGVAVALKGVSFNSREREEQAAEQ